MENVIGYVRVSSDLQARDGHGLETQRAEIDKYCLTKNLNLLHIFEDVQSGASVEKRKGLIAALEMLKAESITSLLVYRQDRFARSVYDAEIVKRELKSLGKNLVIVADPVDWNTDDGNMMFQFKSVFAEYERKQIRKRCQAGMDRKKEAGGYCGGHPPFGYDVVRGELVENAFELRALQCIEDMRNSLYLFRDIAAWLNGLGCVTKRGHIWTGHSVSALYRRRPLIKLKLPMISASD